MTMLSVSPSGSDLPDVPAEVRALGLHSALPDAALSNLVQCFWSLDQGFSSTLPARKLYPDGGASLLLRPQSAKPAAALFFNRETLSQPFQLDEPLLSVRFRPGALHELFGLSPAECLAGEISLIDVLPGPRRNEFFFLLEELAEMGAEEGMARLEQWLMGYLGQSVPYRRRLSQLPGMLFSSRRQLTEVATDLNMSTRTLERHCLREIGMTPSVLLECMRMRSARHLLATTDLPLAQLALLCGYYDQAHFHRSFADFVGETPGAYRRRKLSHFYKA